jgi:hypothetical protein
MSTPNSMDAHLKTPTPKPRGHTRVSSEDRRRSKHAARNTLIFARSLSQS